MDLTISMSRPLIYVMRVEVCISRAYLAFHHI